MTDAPDTTRGFTLIELLVTLAVAVILLTVAVPNYQMFVMNSRMASQANELVGALSLARSEAVKRGAQVSVCASSDGSSCTGGWQQGWIVRDASGVIRVQPALTGGSTLAAGAVTTIIYTPNGRTTLAAATTLTLCPPIPATVKGRAIQVELTGRPYVADAVCP
ncbi:MAG TPA: GspH/FimT family pseudopilin [Thiobacillus sp.]